MPPAENIPRPPIGYYLFDTYGSQPRSAPIPEAPTADELQSMLISLSALQNSATKRAKSTADAIKVGRESLARSAYAYKLEGHEADAAGKYKRGGDEKGALKKGLGAGYPRVPTGGLGPESRRKDGSINGVKVKRETSASPAPTTASEYARPSSSRLGTPVDQMSERASIKNKKRKVTHHGSPEPDSVSVSSHRGRAGSTTREGSVSGGQDRASYAGSHAERPSIVNQPQGSGLKVKLSLSNSGKVSCCEALGINSNVSCRTAPRGRQPIWGHHLYSVRNSRRQAQNRPSSKSSISAYQHHQRQHTNRSCLFVHQYHILQNLCQSAKKM